MLSVETFTVFFGLLALLLSTPVLDQCPPKVFLTAPLRLLKVLKRNYVFYGNKYTFSFCILRIILTFSGRSGAVKKTLGDIDLTRVFIAVTPADQKQP